MTARDEMPDLEAALLERADRLAEEYLARGREHRDAILNEKRRRLRAREERITGEAGAGADRLYRRRVQAAELRLQGDLDRCRWALIQEVLDELPDRAREFSRHRATYEALLRALLAGAAASLDDTHGVAAFNARDLEALRDRWEAFRAEAGPDLAIELDPEPIRCSGGVRVTSADGRERVDATFEGRSERFQDALVRAVADRLFAHDANRTG